MSAAKAEKAAGWLQVPLWGSRVPWKNTEVVLRVGAVFGFWTVIKEPASSLVDSKWQCQCFCGVVRAVKGGNLLSSSSKSCSCPKFCRTALYIKQLKDIWKEKRVSAGICPRCGRPLHRGKTCLLCKDSVVQGNKKRRDVRLANKKCPYCGKVPAPNRKHCQACLNRETSKVFNISVEDVVKLRNCSCAVWGDQERTVIDHDHSTGELRGVLCNNCNAALGFVKEDPVRLEGLIAYIRHYRSLKTEKS